MNRALTFVLVALPSLAFAQTGRWLDSGKEQSIRDVLTLLDWRYLLGGIAFFGLVTFIAKRRWWRPVLVWGPGFITVALILTLGARTLVGFFFDRFDAERNRGRPATTSVPR